MSSCNPTFVKLMPPCVSMSTSAIRWFARLPGGRMSPIAFCHRSQAMRASSLMSLIGPAYTKELFFTARTDFSAQDALRMGLVNQVVPKADLERFTRDYALTMSRNAPLTLRSAKASVDQLVRPEATRDYAMLDRLIKDCFDSQDYQEGVKAFSEKRRPQFQGR